MYERAEGVYGETVRWPDELAATVMEVVEGGGHSLENAFRAASRTTSKNT